MRATIRAAEFCTRGKRERLDSNREEKDGVAEVKSRKNECISNGGGRSVVKVFAYV